MQQYQKRNEKGPTLKIHTQLRIRSELRLARTVQDDSDSCTWGRRRSSSNL